MSSKNRSGKRRGRKPKESKDPASEFSGMFVLPPNILQKLGINLNVGDNQQAQTSSASPVNNPVEIDKASSGLIQGDSKSAKTMQTNEAVHKTTEESSILETANLMKSSVFLSPTFIPPVTNTQIVNTEIEFVSIYQDEIIESQCKKNKTPVANSEEMDLDHETMASINTEVTEHKVVDYSITENTMQALNDGTERNESLKENITNSDAGIVTEKMQDSNNYAGKPFPAYLDDKAMVRSPDLIEALLELDKAEKLLADEIEINEKVTDYESVAKSEKTSKQNLANDVEQKIDAELKKLSPKVVQPNASVEDDVKDLSSGDDIHSQMIENLRKVITSDIFILGDTHGNGSSADLSDVPPINPNSELQKNLLLDDHLDEAYLSDCSNSNLGPSPSGSIESAHETFGPQPKQSPCNYINKNNKISILSEEILVPSRFNSIMENTKKSHQKENLVPVSISSVVSLHKHASPDYTKMAQNILKTEANAERINCVKTSCGENRPILIEFVDEYVSQIPENSTQNQCATQNPSTSADTISEICVDSQTEKEEASEISPSPCNGGLPDYEESHEDQKIKTIKYNPEQKVEEIASYLAKFAHLLTHRKKNALNKIAKTQNLKRRATKSRLRKEGVEKPGGEDKTCDSQEEDNGQSDNVWRTYRISQKIPHPLNHNWDFRTAKTITHENYISLGELPEIDDLKLELNLSDDFGCLCYYETPDDVYDFFNSHQTMDVCLSDILSETDNYIDYIERKNAINSLEGNSDDSPGNICGNTKGETFFEDSITQSVQNNATGDSNEAIAHGAGKNNQIEEDAVIKCEQLLDTRNEVKVENNYRETKICYKRDISGESVANTEHETAEYITLEDILTVDKNLEVNENRAYTNTSHFAHENPHQQSEDTGEVPRFEDNSVVGKTSGRNTRLKIFSAWENDINKIIRDTASNLKKEEIVSDDDNHFEDITDHFAFEALPLCNEESVVVESQLQSNVDKPNENCKAISDENKCEEKIKAARGVTASRMKHRHSAARAATNSQDVPVVTNSPKYDGSETTIHSNDNIKCEVCQKTLAYNEWDDHLSNEHCFIAWKNGETINLKSNALLANLNSRLKASPPLKCTFCNAAFKTCKRFLSHVRQCLEKRANSKNTANESYCACGVCHEKVATEKWLEHSMDRHQNVAWKDGDAPIKLKKDVKRHLERVLMVHGCLQCSECGLVSNNVDSYTAHTNTCISTSSNDKEDSVRRQSSASESDMNLSDLKELKRTSRRSNVPSKNRSTRNSLASPEPPSYQTDDISCSASNDGKIRNSNTPKQKTYEGKASRKISISDVPMKSNDSRNSSSIDIFSTDERMPINRIEGGSEKSLLFQTPKLERKSRKTATDKTPSKKNKLVTNYSETETKTPNKPEKSGDDPPMDDANEEVSIRKKRKRNRLLSDEINTDPCEESFPSSHIRENAETTSDKPVRNSRKSTSNKTPKNSQNNKLVRTDAPGSDMNESEVPNVSPSDLPKTKISKNKTIIPDQSQNVSESSLNLQDAKVGRSGNSESKKVKTETNNIQGGSVECGVCQEKVEADSWMAHSQMKHQYLAWYTGEKAMDMDDETRVLEHLKDLVKKIGSLMCSKCGLTRKYPKPFLMHIRHCDYVPNDNVDDTVEESTPVKTEQYSQFCEDVFANNTQVTCAVCNETIKSEKWKKHAFDQHYNIAWPVGGRPIDLRDKWQVDKVLKEYKSICKTLVCKVCGASRASNLGFYAHILACGKTEEEADEFKDTCEICNQKFLCIYRQQHYSFHAQKELVKERKLLALEEKEKIKQEKIDFADETPSLGKRRKAAEKALKVLDNYSANTGEFTHQCPHCDFGTDRELEMNAHKCTQDFSDSSESAGVESEEESDGSPPDSDLSGEEEMAYGPKKRKRVRASDYKPKLLEVPFAVTNIKKYMKTADRDFCDTHFTSKRLFADCVPSNYEVIPESLVKPYLPTVEESCKVMEDESWTTYKRFESRFGTVLTFFTGAVPCCLSWAPPIYTTDEDLSGSFLAVACHAGNDSPSVESDRTYKHKGLVQIWDFEQFVMTLPSLVMGIAHDYGTVWAMDWCPSGARDVLPAESTAHAGTARLGLLAVACSDGAAYVFSVPYPSALPDRSTVFYKLKPAIELRFDERKQFQCTTIKWSTQKGHSTIVVGYSNGTVASYKMDGSSPFGQSEEQGVKILYPYDDERALNTSITGLDLFASTDETSDTGLMCAASATGLSMWASRGAAVAKTFVHAACSGAQFQPLWPAVMTGGDDPLAVQEVEWDGWRGRCGTRLTAACARTGLVCGAYPPTLRLTLPHRLFKEPPRKNIVVIDMKPLSNKRKKEKENTEFEMKVEPLTYEKAVALYGLELKLLKKEKPWVANELRPERYPLSEVTAMAFCPHPRHHAKMAVATHAGLVFLLHVNAKQLYPQDKRKL